MRQKERTSIARLSVLMVLRGAKINLSISTKQLKILPLLLAVYLPSFLNLFLFRLRPGFQYTLKKNTHHNLVCNKIEYKNFYFCL